MRSIIAALRTLVLPGGATSGQRIVLDGVNGEIRVYDANSELRVRLGVGGEIEVLSGDGDETLTGSMQATVQGVSGSTKVGVLTLESPAVASAGADLRAAVELVSESMDEATQPYVNLIVDSLRLVGREVGLNLITDGMQRETAADSARAAGVNTDMVRTVDLQGGHWYRAGYLGNISIAAGGGTSLSLSRDGSKIGLVDFFPAAGSFKVNGFVDFEAAADDSASVLRLFNDGSSAGNLTLTVNTNEDRTFSVVDLGNDTI